MHGSQRTFHYYRDGRALCGKWALPPSLSDDLDPGNRAVGRKGSYDCTACFRRSRIVVPERLA